MNDFRGKVYRHNIKEILHSREQVLCLCLVQSIHLSKDNYVLVGDSAGMVLPSNGAGITIAMIGGRIAGEVISEHIKLGTPLSEYERTMEISDG